MEGLTNRSSSELFTVPLEGGDDSVGGVHQDSSVKQQGFLKGLGEIASNFKAYFAAAGNKLKDLYYSAKQQIQNSIPGSSSLPSLSSALSTASSSLKSLAKGFSFKAPSFMSSRGAGKASSDTAAKPKENQYTKLATKDLDGEERDSTVGKPVTFIQNTSLMQESDE